jgi:hypothetical protein
MPLKKVMLKPGVNRENTRYTNEGGWYDCDKIRFRQGTPEKIGGWQLLSNNTYNGTCRSLWPWASLAGAPYLGVGTNTKYYIMVGGTYNDITPIQTTTAAGAVTFAATNGSSTITVTSVAHGVTPDTFVTFSGAVSLGGNITAPVLNAQYQVVSVVSANVFTITVSAVANASDVGNGGAATVGAYQVSAGYATETPTAGWGAGGWGLGPWGIGSPSDVSIRIWNAQNFGENLIYGPKGGAMYYWQANTSLTTRGTLLSAEVGASDVPLMQNQIIISDASRFVITFGVNDYGSTSQDPMLIRWSDQESAISWTPAATNQAGSLRLSHGSRIVTALQVRQEILVWTDTSLYSLQYLGPPIVWGSQLLSDNISIISNRAAAYSGGVTYWMGADKFYAYDGRTQTLPCDLLRYVFEDFNNDQAEQVFATTVEKFNEIWWFYCSANSDTTDKYVVFNYVEKVWYYGTLPRTAWLDASIISQYPISAGPISLSSGRLIYHEYGNDDNSTGTPAPITAFITSAEFDIDDGDSFGFVWRVIPDITFRGSSAASPAVTMYLLPLQNSGSGYNNNTSTNSNQSVAGDSFGAVTRIGVYPVEQFTGQINTRIRGRQMSIKVESTELGVAWQLGAPRIDIRPDGRKS